MNGYAYQELITEGIKGLPAELLREAADFVYLLRKLVQDPQGFAEEQSNFLQLRVEAAMRQYPDNEIPLERVAEIAGATRWRWQELLAHLNLPRHIIAATKTGAAIYELRTHP